MPFVGALITPHSPLLLKTVGKEYQPQLRKTNRAFERASEDLYGMKPDAILAIHPHGTSILDAFVGNIAPSFTIKFTEFGDLVTDIARPGSPSLGNHIYQYAERARIPFRLIEDADVSYDVGVPCLLTTAQLPNVPWLPIGTSNHDRDAHLAFGKMLATALHETKLRIALVISAELSQHVNEKAPNGFRIEGQQFDTDMQRLLTKRNFGERLLALDPVQIDHAEACGYLPLLVLSGFLMHKNVHMRKLSYETPFGIGLLTSVVTPV